MSVEAACYLALLGRLYFMGLASRYRFLCAYLVLEALGTGGLAWIPINTWTYTIAYFCVTPVLWVLGYLVVLELCRLILEDYPGVAGAGRRLVNWSMGAAVLVALGFAAHGLRARLGTFPVLRSFAIVHMSVRVGLLFFLLVILYFVYRFRLSLPRNRKLYGVGFAICWGLVLVADALSIGAGTAHYVLLYSCEMLTCSALMVAACFMLKPSGEFRATRGEPDTDERRAILHRRLAEMNHLLTRARNPKIINK
jgi:hypothetical protein